MIDPGCPSLSCQSLKIFGLENFWFIVKFISIVLLFVWYNPNEREDSFSSTCFWHEIIEVMQSNLQLLSLDVSMWYPFWRISLKLSRFLLEYKASFIYNFVPFGNMILALPEPSIKLAEQDIIVTLDLANIKLWKYFLFRRIVCVVALSTKHPSLLFTKWLFKFIVYLNRVSCW